MKELSFASLHAGDVSLNKVLTFHSIDNSYYIRSRFANSLYIKNNLIMVKYWYTNKYNTMCYREYGPSIIITYGPAIVNSSGCYWYSNDDKDITDEVNDWLDSKNIVLSKDNDYEIPDEHKAEFKMRFV